MSAATAFLSSASDTPPPVSNSFSAGTTILVTSLGTHLVDTTVMPCCRRKPLAAPSASQVCHLTFACHTAC